MPRLLFLLFLALAPSCAGPSAGAAASRGDAPWLVVLGIAQDGGVPQAGDPTHPGWEDPARRRLVTCLGLFDPRSGERWLLEATPDLPEELRRLDRLAPRAERPGLAGVLVTHAHVGHYTGLLHLGHEALGARGVPLFAMPRMAAFLRANGPWSQLVRYGNVVLHELSAGEPLALAPDLSVTPLPVPHRQEFSEVVAFRIDGPGKSVLFLPDIDSWEAWDAAGVRLEDVLAEVDVAYLDGTFFDDGELPGRDMSGFPHPFVRRTMERLAPLPATERAKVRFLHLNWSNPALWPGPERDEVLRRGFRLAEEGEVVELGS